MGLGDGVEGALAWEDWSEEVRSVDHESLHVGVKQHTSGVHGTSLEGVAHNHSWVSVIYTHS